MNDVREFSLLGFHVHPLILMRIYDESGVCSRQLGCVLGWKKLS